MKILTFDIEEWFHILDNSSTKSEKEWGNYPSRIDQNMDRIFNLLEKNQQRATFFCLGWIAEKHPHIIREIDRRGFEIGSHTHWHQLVYEQHPEEFRSDVERSIKTIEDVIGKKVKSFRAPGFSITENCPWAFDVLLDLGIEVDSSVFPVSRAHGGFPSYGSVEPSIIERSGMFLKEFPISTGNIMNKHFIYSGGGYFRLLPYPLIKYLTENSDYLMSYLHPRDLDPDQPIIEDLSYYRKFKSYVGLKDAEAKLHNWLTDFKFIDLQTADKMVDWKKVKQISMDLDLV